jgi:hypothetical protein
VSGRFRERADGLDAVSFDEDLGGDYFLHYDIHEVAGQSFHIFVFFNLREIKEIISLSAKPVSMRRFVLYSCMTPVLLVSLVASLLASQGVFGQTADAIIAKYIDALGGKDKLLSIHSLYQEGVAVMQNGNEIDTKTWKVQGQLYRQEINFGMGSVIVIITPKGGWSSNPRTGGTFKELTPEQFQAGQLEMDPAGPLVDYATKGSKAELLGKDTVNGTECWLVDLTLSNGNEIKYSFDGKTGYILRESIKGGGLMGGGRRGGGAAPGGGGGNGAAPGGPGGMYSIDFKDYQKTADGYIFPMTIIAGSFGAKTSVEKLEVNKPVDVAALSKPSN